MQRGHQQGQPPNRSRACAFPPRPVDNEHDQSSKIDDDAPDLSLPAEVQAPRKFLIDEWGQRVDSQGRVTRARGCKGSGTRRNQKKIKSLKIGWQTKGIKLGERCV